MSVICVVWIHATLVLVVSYKLIHVPVFVEDDVIVTIDAGLAYRDDLIFEWTTKFYSVEKRPLRCVLAVPKVNLHDCIYYMQMNSGQMCLVTCNSPCFCRDMKMKAAFITVTLYH